MAKFVWSIKVCPFEYSPGKNTFSLLLSLQRNPCHTYFCALAHTQGKRHPITEKHESWIFPRCLWRLLVKAPGLTSYQTFVRSSGLGARKIVFLYRTSELSQKETLPNLHSFFFGFAFFWPPPCQPPPTQIRRPSARRDAVRFVHHACIMPLTPPRLEE